MLDSGPQTGSDTWLRAESEDLMINSIPSSPVLSGGGGYAVCVLTFSCDRFRCLNGTGCYAVPVKISGNQSGEDNMQLPPSGCVR